MTHLMATSNPIYENIQVLNVDGDLIFRANSKRANWYLNKGIAKVVSEDPYTIQFLFKTKGYGKKNDPFYLQEMKNICVVCGVEKNLNKHHVVPFCYRSHFPEEFKSHSSHDVLPLCRPCHGQYEAKAYQFRRVLSKEFDVSLGGRYLADRALSRIVAFARTLRKHGNKIPEEKKNWMLETIKERFPGEIDDEKLREISKMVWSVDIVKHGKMLAEKITNIPEFIRRWREHFMEHAQPKFLPEHWSVDRVEP